MTTGAIIQQLKNAGKGVSLMQVYRYMEKLKIKPSGPRQRPQHYPEDTADRILQHLGLGAFRQIVAPGQVYPLTPPTMKELRRARKQATKGTK